jgi:hypothetical protein
LLTILSGFLRESRMVRLKYNFRDDDPHDKVVSVHHAYR